MRFPRSFHAMPPPAELLAAAARRRPCSRDLTPHPRAHQSRLLSLVPASRRSAAA